MVLLIIGLILFIGLVVVHELGHFFAARRNGVDVEEFGIGFPPKIWAKKITPKDKTKSPWLFTINLLPLGGFVRLKGEHDSDTEEGTFGAASLRAKTEIMAAGVVMNLITGLILLTLLALVGIPRILPNQFTVASDTKVIKSEVLVGAVADNSPADKAGLQAGDSIRKLGVAMTAGGSAADPGTTTYVDKDGDAVDLSKTAFADLTKSFAGQEVAIEYVRNGQVKQAEATLLSEKEVSDSRKTRNIKGYLGVNNPFPYTLQRSTWSAPVVALGLTKQITVLTFQGLGKALAGVGSIIAGAVTGNTEARREGQTVASSQVSGPLGIFFVLKNNTILGFQFMLFIIAIISLTLAIMNFLPIPALDGGRLWLTLATRGIGRPISQEKEELINGVGFLFLLGLIALITFVDVKRFF